MKNCPREQACGQFFWIKMIDLVHINNQNSPKNELFA